MKLLTISHTCINPAHQQFFAELERQTNWQITIVTPSKWKETGKILIPEPWPEYQGQLLHIPVWRAGSIRGHIYRSTFIQLLKEIEPDFIFMRLEADTTATGQVYLANKLSINKPTAFFTWENIFKRYSRYSAILRQIESFVYKNTSVAFTGSRSAAAVLRKKGYQGNCTMLPWGIDTDIYTSSPQAEELKSKLRVTENEVIVGYVGRIIAEKGLKTLLHALYQIQELPWRLVMVGSGEYETEFKRIANELNLNQRINYVGHISYKEVSLYLSAFDLLVLPSETQTSWKEQFGKVIIESMACNTPVIGSSSGEIPYLIKSTGGGLTFPEAQPKALAEQLSKLIMNPNLRLSFGKKGRQAVVQNYTDSSLAKGFADTIEKVVTNQQK